MGFYILPRADDKEASTYQEKRYVQKKEKEEKESIYQEAQRTSSWTRGLTS
jgi:hypothetical protein